jgi:hypothetical protein
LSRAWDEWVLDNGLPELRARLAAGESVPIAYWSGPEFGAVVHLVDCDHDPYCGSDEHYVTDVRCFRRTSGRWEEARGSTGTGSRHINHRSPRNVVAREGPVGGN